MDEFSTSPIQEAIRATDSRQERAPARQQPLERKLRVRKGDAETDEQDVPDDTVANGESGHRVDVSV